MQLQGKAVSLFCGEIDHSPLGEMPAKRLFGVLLDIES
jgi:hypothetical protein